jgi:cell division protein FtsB
MVHFICTARSAARSASAGRARSPATAASKPLLSESHHSYEALRRTIDALVKQNERLEERVTLHQKELASLRETGRGGTGSKRWQNFV